MRGERVVILTNTKTGHKSRVNKPFFDWAGNPIILEIGKPLYKELPSIIVTKILKTLYRPKTKF